MLRVKFAPDAAQESLGMGLERDAAFLGGGFRVATVAFSCAASRAGVVAGDFLVKANGVSLDDVEDFGAFLKLNLDYISENGLSFDVARDINTPAPQSTRQQHSGSRDTESHTE